MKRSTKITIACGMAVILAMASTLVFTKPQTTEVLRQRKAPDTALARENWVYIEPEATALDVNALQSANPSLTLENDKGLLLSTDDSMTFSLDVPATGEYQIAVTYLPAASSMLDRLVVVAQNGEEAHAFLSSLWVDAKLEYPTDAFLNERFPEPMNLMEPTTDFLRAYNSVNKSPVVYSLEAGTTEVTLTNVTDAIYVSSVQLSPKKEAPSYDEYYTNAVAEHSDELGNDLVIIEGEDYSVKSDSFINGKILRDLSITPYDTYRNLISILNGKSWNVPGKRAMWEFNIDDAGFYKIALNSQQNDEASGGANVFRNVEIDGQYLFAEMDAVQFPFGKQFVMTTLGNQEQEYMFYLEPGKHTITMGVTTGSGEQIIEKINDMMKQINDIGLDLKKLSAGSEDKNRTWDMSVYLPDVVPALEQVALDLEALHAEIEVFNGGEAKFANDLLYSAQDVRKLLKDTRNLPNRIDRLSEGDSSVTAALGGVLTKMTGQTMNLDKICIYGTNQYEPNSSSFVQGLAESLRLFVRTFTPAATQGGLGTSYDKKPDVLKVWFNRPLQYTQIMRNMVEAEYADNAEMEVEVSYINDLNKLILSNASGTNPDVVVGMQYDKVFDFALRGAAKDLTEFEDFIPFYTEHYAWNSLVPVSYNGGVYGAMDTNNLRLMFYRTDIMESLGLEVPETWDDVHELMPELLRYSMNFNLPMSNEVGYKPLDVTGAFFFQHGGQLYAEDGTATTITSPESVDGFTEMTDIYRIYGVREQIPNFFNSFRYGEVPIGIGDVDTYTQLQLAAPEIAGKWDIALLPGVRQADGSIVRDYPVARTATMVFENTDKPEAAYDFLKWWLSTDTQVKYAYSLQATYGPEFYWNPANLDAMAQIYYKPEHLKLMMEQWESGRENVRHPAGYMVERAISDAWTKVVVDQDNKMVSIDYAAMLADREIRRKLVEFGYLDELGNPQGEYITDTVERLKMQLEGQK